MMQKEGFFCALPMDPSKTAIGEFARSRGGDATIGEP